MELIAFTHVIQQFTEPGWPTVYEYGEGRPDDRQVEIVRSPPRRGMKPIAGKLLWDRETSDTFGEVVFVDEWNGVKPFPKKRGHWTLHKIFVGKDRRIFARAHCTGPTCGGKATTSWRDFDASNWTLREHRHCDTCGRQLKRERLRRTGSLEPEL